jgi:hypothetical protein
MEVVVKMKQFVDWLTKLYNLVEPESKAVLQMISQTNTLIPDKGPKRSLRSRQLDD